MRSGRERALAMFGAVSLSACSLALDVPSPPAPPAIEFAGVPDEVHLGRTITYVLADGGTLEVEPAGYREIGPAGWSGELVVLGWDAEGAFVAGFMRQAGLTRLLRRERNRARSRCIYRDPRRTLGEELEVRCRRAGPAGRRLSEWDAILLRRCG
jgi:hypothetical protein